MPAPDPIPPAPPGAKPVDTPCPNCGVPALHIEARLKAKPIGSFSLSGAQMKVSAHETVFLVCRGCGARVEGDVEPGGTHATFDPALMKATDPDAKETQ